MSPHGNSGAGNWSYPTLEGSYWALLASRRIQELWLSQSKEPGLAGLYGDRCPFGTGRLRRGAFGAAGRCKFGHVCR